MPQVDALWQRYKLHNDLQAREQIILAYSHLAKHTVDRMPVRPSAVISYDDLLGHAILGLIDAVERFDLSHDVKFETYALSRIRGAVLDAIKSIDWVPRSVRASGRRLREVVSALEADLGRPATDEEIARAMGISIDELDEAFADIGQSAMLSLEELILCGGEATADCGLEWADDCDPVTAAEMEERKRLLAEAVGTLPDKEKLVVSLYYVDGLTFKEIAKVLGVTESRVCQLHSKAIVRLNGKLARYEGVLSAA